jgi:hypothetical protein
MIGGPAHPVPCPALDTWPTAKLPATHAYQRLDLATVTVDGKPILGMTPAQVTAALGEPDRAAGFKHLGFGQPAYFYGGKLPSGTLLRVQFRRNRQGTKAIELEFQGRGLRDAELGHLLNLTPLSLQQELIAAGRFRLASAYGSAPAVLGFPGGGCSGIATTKAGILISFGVNPYAGTRPYLSIEAR